MMGTLVQPVGRGGRGARTAHDLSTMCSHTHTQCGRVSPVTGGSVENVVIASMCYIRIGLKECVPRADLCRATATFVTEQTRKG